MAATSGLVGACSKDRGAPSAQGVEPTANCGGTTDAARPEGQTGFPSAIAGKDADAFMLHDPGAPNAEPKREFMSASVVTAYSRFFVRNNLPVHTVTDGEGFAISVEGVTRPGMVTVAELRRLPWVVVPAVLQCSGNGRAYFPDKSPGAPWAVGAAGLAFWAGVPVSVLAERFGGPAPETRFLTISGAERDTADKARVERSIPIAKGMQDALLALEMNGEPLRPAHGAPVRLVVPGYYGINWVKYPRRLAFTTAESDAPIMTTTYRVAPLGGMESADQETCWAMNVKSWIIAPLNARPFPAGPISVRGVAFAGERAVRQVEVTTDSGRTWAAVRLVDPDLGHGAWRQFEFTFEATPGNHTLASRASDAAGNTQPELSKANLRGHRANGWRGPAVDVVVS